MYLFNVCYMPLTQTLGIAVQYNKFCSILFYSIFINMPKLCYVDKDLVMHVLQDLCIKIWKNKYINLAAFLKKNKTRGPLVL